MEEKKACGLHCIRMNHIGVKAGKQELIHDVNLHFHCGELAVIIGRNGAGKSTLLKAILGEIPHTGDIQFRDREDGTIQKLTIGYVPQTINIDRNSPASVYDMFASYVSDYPVFWRQKKKLKKEIVDQLNIFRAGRLIDQRVGSLSGGELQRVMLSIATMPRPNLLILDEPASGIDKAGMELFYHIITDLKDNYDMSVILVSHDLDFVEQYADKVILLDKTVLCEGTPRHVFSSQEFRDVFHVPMYTGEPKSPVRKEKI